MANDAQYVRETVDLVKQIETRFLELGSRLYAIRERALWRDTYESYGEFLEAAKITPSMASILASVHRRYVVEGGQPTEALAGIGYSNLYSSIPLIERVGVDRALAVAGTLTREEIMREVRDPHDACGHRETIVICVKCKKRVRE